MSATWYALSQTDDNQAEVCIYDEIGAFGVGAKQFLADIGKLAGKHLHVRINSPGGSVTEGTAIFNALRRHQGGVTVHIDALAASMASVIAMAGAPVLMADNALFMLHNPWTITLGSSDDLRKEADLLDKLKVNLRNAYVRKTGMTEDRVQELMDAETWLDSVEAVALGFADAIEDGLEAAASVTPEKLRARFDTFKAGIMTNQVTEPEAEEVAPVETAEGTITPEAPEVEAEAAPVVEPVVEAPAEPQASVGNAILEKVNALNARCAELEAKVVEIAADRDAKVSVLSAELSREKELHDQLARTLGCGAAAVVPVIDQSATQRKSVKEQFAEIKDPAERSKFYNEHRKELLASI